MRVKKANNPIGIDLPLAWFDDFTRALDSGDLGRAAVAQAELRKHGYDVRPAGRMPRRVKLPLEVKR